MDPGSRAAKGSGVIINPAAYSHTSIAIYDAFKAFDKPVIAVHLSNPHQREVFRHQDYVSLVAPRGHLYSSATGYLLAVEAMAGLVERFQGKCPK